jgi:hypothetical protein
MLLDVPPQFTAAYARVYVDILQYNTGSREAGDEVGVVRGLKRFLAIDAILLRRTGRG